MAGNPEYRPMIRNEREQRAAESGEPLYDPELAVYRNGNGLVIGIPSVACDILDIDAGDTHRVEVHREGIWIPRGTDAE
jgi:hypothetical protein